MNSKYVPWYLVLGLAFVQPSVKTEAAQPHFSEFKKEDRARVEFEEGDPSTFPVFPTSQREGDWASSVFDKLSATMITREGEMFRSKSSPHQRSGSRTASNLAIKTAQPDFGILSVLGEYPRQLIADTTQWPYRAVGRISLGCTGTLIGPRHILTAGHCVYNIRTKKWNSNLDFSPGRNGNSFPNGTIGWEKAFAPDGWTKDGDWEYDYAIITLKEPIGEKLGWFPFKAMDLHKNGEAITIAGYPADKTNGTAWEVSCPTQLESDRKIYYKCDSYGGMSGSAVRSRDGAAGEVIEGIHAYGGATSNSATKISKEIYSQLLQWTNS